MSKPPEIDADGLPEKALRSLERVSIGFFRRHWRGVEILSITPRPVLTVEHWQLLEQRDEGWRIYPDPLPSVVGLKQSLDELSSDPPAGFGWRIIEERLLGSRAEDCAACGARGTIGCPHCLGTGRQGCAACGSQNVVVEEDTRREQVSRLFGGTTEALRAGRRSYLCPCLDGAPCSHCTEGLRPCPDCAGDGQVEMQRVARLSYVPLRRKAEHAALPVPEMLRRRAPPYVLAEGDDPHAQLAEPLDPEESAFLQAFLASPPERPGRVLRQRLRLSRQAFWRIRFREPTGGEREVWAYGAGLEVPREEVPLAVRRMFRLAVASVALLCLAVLLPLGIYFGADWLQRGKTSAPPVELPMEDPGGGSR